MPSEFDEFSERAFAHYDGGSLESCDNRGLLVRTMARFGFAVNPREWWHFDFHTWREYELLDQPLEPSPRVKGTVAVVGSYACIGVDCAAGVHRECTAYSRDSRVRDS